MDPSQNSRDEIAQAYFDSLPFDPYPVQEEALLAWFTEQQGVLVCAPTGTGKTLIAEAAVFESLKLDKTTYYTTPLIALTDQKFYELQESAVRWGYSANDVGLVTGNRKVNPAAKIQVVVAEILLNRLLQPEVFDFNEVWAVVMDEFHSFNDPQRGIVWEFGLGLLPANVKTLLLSATVGNAMEFTSWLSQKHERRVKLVQSEDRKVPLSYQWVGDSLLPDHVEEMIKGEESARRTPALVFCFNRDQCWSVAELLKGKKVIDSHRQKELAALIDQYNWSEGAGPKLKQILMRGIGVHHAGVLPKYRRIVESLFQDKLLSVCVCTETLAAGINLPARSVVLPSIIKGPPGKLKLIEPSSAHQMFGRAGRPQFDDQGFVYALAHEDDVKILRWQEKFDQIPADTRDPGLLKAKKQLKKKQPKRREGVQYWDEAQFERLIKSPPADLASRGNLPWRLLAYMLTLSPEVEPIRQLIAKRLLDVKNAERAQKQLTDTLIVLWRAGYVELDPLPPIGNQQTEQEPEAEPKPKETGGMFSTALLDQLAGKSGGNKSTSGSTGNKQNDQQEAKPEYRPKTAQPTERLPQLLQLRAVHPLYGVFLMNQLGIADHAEKIQAMESLLELPRSLGKPIRVPRQDELPPGPLATTRLDEQLLKLGLATAEELREPDEDEEDDRHQASWGEERVYVLTLAHKLQRLFEHDFPGVHDLRIWPCWVAGELLEFNCDFNKYITSKGLQKQEGMVFRHLLRLVLLIDEFAQLCPPEIDQKDWQDELGEIADKLEATCRRVDSQSTEQWLENTREKIES